MPTCFRCSDGSVICGNPPPPCDDELGLMAAPSGGETERAIKFDRIEVDVHDGGLRVTTDPAFDLGNPSRVVIGYDPRGRGLFFRFT